MKLHLFHAIKSSGCLALAASMLAGCFGKMSETADDASAGMNGSFEVVRSGLPVNWLVYTPATIPTGDYELILDTTDFKHGKQSLRFEVRECSSTGGWHSPGLSKEYPAVAGDIYGISFWIKNEGSAFRAVIGGVSAFEGQYDTIIESEDPAPDWKKIEYEYRMPAEFDTIRFELNVLRPGTFLIDDIRLEHLNQPASGGA